MKAEDRLMYDARSPSLFLNIASQSIFSRTLALFQKLSRRDRHLSSTSQEAALSEPFCYKSHGKEFLNEV